MAWTHGHFYWNELMTRDADQARSFYGDALGWTFNPMDMPNGTYWVIMQGDTPAGGIMTMDGADFDGVPEHWFSYVAVDDVDARTAKAADGGGTVIRGPFDVAGVGRIAIIKQPGGGMVGWMTPADG